MEGRKNTYTLSASWWKRNIGMITPEIKLCRLSERMGGNGLEGMGEWDWSSKNEGEATFSQNMFFIALTLRRMQYCTYLKTELKSAGTRRKPQMGHEQ